MMHYTVQCNGDSMKQPSTTQNASSARSETRDAIVSAAERLFLEQGFDGVSMDQLAAAAGVARRTLYNQFGGKEDIFREVLRRLSDRISAALPPGIETQGDVDAVLRLVGQAVLAFQGTTQFIGLMRMAVAGVRQFPWIAQEFTGILEIHLERFARYLSHLTTLGVLDCPHPVLAAHQFLGLINEPILWRSVLNQEIISCTPEIVVEDAVRTFLGRYRVKTVENKKE